MLEDYIALDLEMTGLDPKKDRILEIGAVKVKGKREKESISFLIRQEKELPIQITELTGITDEMAGSGENLDDAMEAFLEFAGEMTWVGHNVAFDHKFIRQWETDHGFKKTHYAVDTLKIARKCLPDLEKKSLDFLCAHFGIERERRHRALEDAKASHALYEILERDFFDRSPDLFGPKELVYNPKRQAPATERQKKYLKELKEYHKIVADISVDALSRSEASRLINQIIRERGRLSVLERQAMRNHRP